MTGLGEGDGVLHGLAVADLADQNHVRRLAQGIGQRVFVAVGVHADFTLIDDGFFVMVDEFDRVFDGDYMSGAAAVADIDQRGQRGGLAGTGGADKQDQSALGHDQVNEAARQPQRFHAWDGGLDVAHYHRHLAALFENVDAETPDAGLGNRQVHFRLAFKLGALLGVHDLVGNLLDAAAGELGDVQRHHLTVDLAARECAGAEVEVGGIALDHDL